MNLENVLIVINPKKESTPGILEELKRELSKRNIDFYEVSTTYFQLKSKEEILSDFDDAYRHRKYQMIFTIGGDGTFLYTARTFSVFDLPIVGINAGRLGFLTEVLPERISEVLDKIQNGTAKFTKRFLLKASLFREEKIIADLIALNDMVISRGRFSRLVEVDVRVHDQDDEKSEGNFLSGYRADGVIISSPIGSTAYNLSAGGPILMPNTEALVITPISPHTLGVRPVVVGIRRMIELTIPKSGADLKLTADGQENLELTAGDTVCVEKSDRCISMYYEGDENFFMTLREKLGWHL